MLLIALTLTKDGFWLPYEPGAREWYGVSSDSAEEGLKELRKIGLLDAESNWIKAPRVGDGLDRAAALHVAGAVLHGRARRRRPAHIHGRAPEGGELPPPYPRRRGSCPPSSSLLGWKPTLVEFMTGKAPTPDELMSRKGSA